MSLVPYSSRDSREIVLAHDNTLVLRDPQSKQLILRGRANQHKPSECPYCRRPLPKPRRPSNDSVDHHDDREGSWVSPEYFRLLRSRDAFDEVESSENSAPSSPIRRLVEPFTSERDLAVDKAEFITSTPDTSRPGITRDAFSPNYFQRFFVEERELGSGGKGVVLLVRHVLDGFNLGYFACKRVPVGDDHEWLAKVLVEVQLLQGLSHPNLVSYRHSWLQDTKLSRFQPSIPCAFILQEYCNSGDLLHYIIGHTNTGPSSKEELKEKMRRRSKGQSDHSKKDLPRKLSFDEIYSLFRDITCGLAYLHNANYIHRDLKPSNCLLHQTDKGLRCLISDFGEVQSENAVRKSTGATGTISYCAPEVLRKDASGRYGNFTTKSDIFSLGMILYFMCFRRLPYISAATEEAEDVDLLREEISRWEGFVLEKVERPELPEQYYEFLRKLLALDPAQRPSAADIEKALLNNTNTGFGIGNSKANRTGSLDNQDSKKRITVVESPENNGNRTSSSAYMEEVIDSSDDNPNPKSSDRIKTTTLLHRRSNSSPHPISLTPILRHRSQSPAQHLTPTTPSRTPPLLMAPPSTTMSNIQHRFHIHLHHFRLWLANPHNLHLLTTAKVLIFMLKIMAMNWLCGSRSVRSGFSYLLLALAALDVAWTGDWRVHVVLFVAHFLIVELGIIGGGLCGGREWEWDVMGG